MVAIGHLTLRFASATLSEFGPTGRSPGKVGTASFGRLYTELVYQPMIEVLRYLRANDFKTYIVSGLGQFFMRIYTQRVYGIPSEQVLGSSVVTKYQIENGKPELIREPKLFLYSNLAASRSPSTFSLASGPMPPSAIPPATARCSNGLVPVTAHG